MKHNARNLLALAMALALLLSMFAMAEDGGPEVIDLGGDIVIDEGTGTVGEAQGGAGELEIEMDAGEALPDAPEIDPDAGLGLDAGPDLDAGAPENVVNAEAAVVNDEETWVAWESTESLPVVSGNYTIDHPVTLNDTWWIPENTTIKVKLGRDCNIVMVPENRVLISVTWNSTLDIIGEENCELRSNFSNIYNEGTCRLSGCRLYSNDISVFVNRGNFTMDGSTITVNDKEGTYRARGVGVCAHGGRATINSGTIRDYHCGVYVYDGGRVTMTGGTITNNGISYSEHSGYINSVGGVFVDENSTFTMTGGTISGNTAPSGGGVCLNKNGAFIMEGGTISGNTASYGGGVYVNRYSSFTMAGGTITDNRSNATEGRGGGVYVCRDSSFIMAGGRISGNTAPDGGGVHVAGGFTMKNGTIADNKADIGGGVFVVWDGSFTMEGGTIEANTANAASGGGVYVDRKGTFNLTGGTISGNTATEGGGVYTLNKSDLTMEGGTITGNTAPNGGGVCANGTFTMSGGAIEKNKATSENGGGVYLGKGGVFNLKGGKVNNNDTQTDGAGVYVSREAAFNMSGGEICLNNVPGRLSPDHNFGAGIRNDYGTFNMSGGRIVANHGVGIASGGSFNLSGQVVIKANTRNIRMDRPGDIINVVGKLSTDDPIGVCYLDDNLPLGDGVMFTSGLKDHGSADQFRSQQGDYYAIVAHPSGEAVLGVPVKVTFEKGNDAAKGIMPPQTAARNIEWPLNANAYTRSGYTFAGWNTHPDGTGKAYADGAVVKLEEHTTLYAQWKKAGNLPIEGDEAQPDAALLARLTVSGSGRTALKLTWTAADGADGYDVFFARCGRDYKDKNVTTVTGTSLRLTGLKPRKEYKAYVRAWQVVDGEVVYLGDSPEVHAITGGYDAKYCNAKSVTLNRDKLTLKAGRRATLKATVKGVKSGRKLLDHVEKVRWYSSNANVAAVDSSGRITATGQGQCTVYAIANNGVRAEVKVTVK